MKIDDVLLVVIACGVAALIALVSVFLTKDYIYKEAVDNGAAYWCIVDHQKVFSWKPCEELR